MIRPALRVAFWGAVGLVAHVVVVFPALVAARALRRPAQVTRRAVAELEPPSLTVVIAAHDEAAVIARKVRNTLALDHPGDRLAVVVACDGCSDGTPELTRAAAGGDQRVTVLDLPRGGKNAALRAALACVPNGVVLFTDADAVLDPDAATLLLAPMADPAVGGTAGRVAFARDGVPSGEAAYWSAEDRLRRLLSRGGSLTAATGPLYAVRRELVEAPPDGVTDDFWISVQVPLSGHRLLFVPAAVAALPPPPPARDEFRRKVRIMCAGLRGVWRIRRRMRLRWIDLQIVTHKGLRRLLVVPGMVAVACGLALRREGAVYRLVGSGGAAAVAVATVALAARETRLGRLRPVAVAAHLAAASLASLVAVRDLVLGRRHDRWGGDD
jgi:cellulose synthase/poly-beta-1,6-N-acetylglucosamine synthase-like glycosyltransferase